MTSSTKRWRRYIRHYRCIFIERIVDFKIFKSHFSTAKKNSWQLERKDLSSKSDDERKKAELGRIEASRQAQKTAEESVAKILAEMEKLKSTHSDQLRHASDDYNEKIEKLKGLHEREMKLIREELELEVK